MIGLLSFLGVWTSGEAPPPVVVVELEAIERSFSVDNKPMHLLPHEWRQMKRIKTIWARDRKRAMLALRILSKNATQARRGLRTGRMVAA